MSVGLPQYGEYMYVWWGINAAPPQAGDLVMLHRNMARAGVVLKILMPPGPTWQNSGRYLILWTDGKKSQVNGSSLLKAPQILADATRFYMNLERAVSQAGALKGRILLNGELDELA